MIRQSVVLAVVGGLAGIGLAAAGTQTLDSLLRGVTSGDRATFVAAFVSMLTVAAVSASLPAFRAGRVDPVEALKSE